MKVFEVLTEYPKENSTEIVTETRYVTSEANTLQSVVDHFTKECEQFGQELKGVREVVTICQHLQNTED